MQRQKYIKTLKFIFLLCLLHSATSIACFLAVKSVPFRKKGLGIREPIHSNHTSNFLLILYYWNVTLVGTVPVEMKNWWYNIVFRNFSFYSSIGLIILKLSYAITFSMALYQVIATGDKIS